MRTPSPYLASSTESAPVEVLERAAQLIDRLARRIEDALLAPVDDTSAVRRGVIYAATGSIRPRR